MPFALETFVLLDFQLGSYLSKIICFLCCDLQINDLINSHLLLQSLRGPRGGMIFFKKDPVLGVDLESAINNAVFPGLQVTCYCMLEFDLGFFFLCNSLSKY